MQRRPGFETKEVQTQVNREKLKHQPVLEISDKSSKIQPSLIRGWNEMRERLLEMGEMEKES